MKTINLDGYLLKLGQNKEENHTLLEEKDPKHTWFHLEDLPSAHLWINESYNNLSKAVIYKCAIELKKSGKYRKSNHVRIMYALGEDVSSSGQNIGEVVTKKYRTINA